MPLDLWEELNKISETSTEYYNDTDLDLETLLNMEWQHCKAETSKFSSTRQITILSPQVSMLIKYLVMALLNSMN